MCLKTALYSFFGQPGFCLIFIFSKNKDFQSGALNVNFISFHGEILSRYSEMNKFRRLNIQKITKTVKKAGVKGKYDKYEETVCFNGYSL